MNDKITLDDPRLTAYALNELEDAQDSALIETALKQDPELQAYVDDIRALEGAISAGFGSEKALPLERNLVVSKKTSVWRFAIPLGLAASVAVLANWHFSQDDFATEQVTQRAPVTESIPEEPSPEELVAQVKAQEEKVEEARLRMLDLAERYRIVDVSSIENRASMTGDPVTGTGTIVMASMNDTFEAENAAAQLRMQREQLEGLEGEKLVQSAAMLDVSDPTLNALLPQHQRKQLERQQLLEQGLSDNHPKVRGLSDQLESSEILLADAATSLRSTLDTKLEMATRSLGLAKDMEEGKKDTSMDERRKYAEYSEAAKEYKLQKQLLAKTQVASLGEPPLASELAMNDPTKRGRTATTRRAKKSDATPRGTIPTPGSSKKGFVPESKMAGPPRSAESYAPLTDQAFKTIAKPGDERTTFSSDVDTASYANVRRFLNEGQLPPADAVRVEEMINYFDYAYENPEGEARPFSVGLEVNESPWKAEHRLLRIALKARDVAVDRRPDSNLVFLVDVSGSMQPYNKLPLLKKSLISMVRGLTERDRISLVVYAGQSRVVLEPTPGSEKSRIISAIDSLGARSGTNGAAGIATAYELAKKHALANGVNRLILATDGDFNVGVTDTSELISMAKAHAKKDHIFLTVLGFGQDNIKDDRMEQLANQVDGDYHYIDNEAEGRKVLVNEMSATLVPMAKDVKIQVEFNPAKVKQYRLIGYANRRLKNRDFADDTKDAGEMGAGHTVTAFYEIVPTGVDAWSPNESPLKYRSAEPDTRAPQDGAFDDIIASDELVTVRLRYKQPKGETSQLLEFATEDTGATWKEASEDFRFAASVAAFGMRLRDSAYCHANLEQVKAWAAAATSRDEFGYRQEFLALVDKARALQNR